MSVSRPKNLVSFGCLHPIQVTCADGSSRFVPCRQCAYCRVHAADTLSNLGTLELLDNPCSLFVTLTYRNRDIPKASLIYDGHICNLVDTDTGEILTQQFHTIDERKFLGKISKNYVKRFPAYFSFGQIPVLKIIDIQRFIARVRERVRRKFGKNTLFVSFTALNMAKLRSALTFTLYFLVNPKTCALTCTKLRVNVGTMVIWFPSITSEITPAILLRICQAVLIFHRYIAQAVLNPAPVTRKNSAALMLKKITASSVVLPRVALSRSLSRAMVKTNPLTLHLLLKVPFSPAVATLAASMISFASAVIVSRLDLLGLARQKLQKN